jgi:NAD(P)-dependent dehydrogenase (short-subunit alcohol dehydrogenase family)
MGADVVLAHRRSNDLVKELASQVGELGARAVEVGADIADPQGATTVMDAAVEAFGRVDILVNNAGVMDARAFVTQSSADWQSMVDVNIMGLVRMTDAVTKVMRTQGSGCIVNLASQLAHTGGKNFAVYSGTKAFVLAFTRSLARELGPDGIRVNAVCPGSIVTDMNRHIYPPEAMRRRAAELPLRRMGEPSDVAKTVRYLVSGSADFVTGQCVDVNGGSTMV